ncbi:2155_t:CDS:2 [Rhizophagus irregularis]|uniref:Uncharacterized protein n=1 Tax=Rhizophagus irregularis (strain DAOM 197198w) TaxID=1432141 RepID=A0A015K2A2_RHIIW|nr:hypothetical protein RirG_037650 [Rhizophagus irregularis DAOM 197198w]CAG8529647.1 2155_t:CDS:2 [Rhizophagus irregularis]
MGSGLRRSRSDPINRQKEKFTLRIDKRRNSLSEWTKGEIHSPNGQKEKFTLRIDKGEIHSPNEGEHRLPNNIKNKTLYIKIRVEQDKDKMLTR